MSQPVLLNNSFLAGVKSDFARNRMPANSLLDGRDIILNYGAAARQRGGWENHSQDLSELVASDYIRGGIYATFSTPGGGEASHNIAINEDGWVFNVIDEGAAISVGQAVQIAQNPFYHGSTAAQAPVPVYTGLVIIPDANGVSPPKKFDGSAITDLNGSPPYAKYGTVYKDYTILFNGAVGADFYPSRGWFSPEGDPDVASSGSQTAWDTTDSWRDFFLPVKGAASIRNACMVFHDSHVSRIRGDIPPPGDDTDMIFEDGLFNLGLLDTFSITTYKENIYWAAPEGVYRTDGVVQDDLSKKGGMLRHWLDLVERSDDDWGFTSGVQRDTLFMFATNGTTFEDGFAIDLQSNAWTRMSNMDAASCWPGLFGRGDELYWGRRGAARVARMSSIYDVGNPLLTSDGNGEEVLPYVALAFNEGGKPGLKRYRRIFVGAEITDHADTGPSVDVGYTTTPEETTYTNAGFISPSDTYSRVAIPVNKRGTGISVDFTRRGEGDFLLHDVGVEIMRQEESKRV